jgi:hypothetical protein
MSLAVLPGSVANATSTPLCCPTGTNPLPPRAPCKVLRHRAPDSAPRSDLATQDRQHLALHDACTLSKTVRRLIKWSMHRPLRPLPRGLARAAFSGLCPSRRSPPVPGHLSLLDVRVQKQAAGRKAVLRLLPGGVAVTIFGGLGRYRPGLLSVSGRAC